LAEVLVQQKDFEGKNDSLIAISQQNINAGILQQKIAALIAAESALTIYKDVSIKALKKSGTDWRLELAQKQGSFKLKAVVDASEQGELRSYRAYDASDVQMEKLVPATQLSPAHRRSSLGVGQSSTLVYALPIQFLLPKIGDNFFHIAALKQLGKSDLENLPLRAAYGQALGAIAGYCAFFKTSTQDILPRKVQEELLGYRVRFLPFQDLRLEDPCFQEIQKIGLSGLLVGRLYAGRYIYGLTDTISREELKSPLNQLFSRAQLWSTASRPQQALTLGETVDLIRLIGQRGAELEKELQQHWSTTWQFRDAYRADLPVTRQQFAALVATYVKTLHVRIDVAGEVIR